MLDSAVEALNHPLRQYSAIVSPFAFEMHTSKLIQRKATQRWGCRAYSWVPWGGVNPLKTEATRVGYLQRKVCRFGSSDDSSGQCSPNGAQPSSSPAAARTAPPDAVPAAPPASEARGARLPLLRRHARVAQLELAGARPVEGPCLPRLPRPPPDHVIGEVPGVHALEHQQPEAEVGVEHLLGGTLGALPLLSGRRLLLRGRLSLAGGGPRRGGHVLPADGAIGVVVQPLLQTWKICNSGKGGTRLWRGGR